MNDAVLALLLATVAASPGVIALIVNQRKTRAESNSLEVQTLRDTIDSIRVDGIETRKALEELEAKFKECKEDLEGTIAEQAVLNRAFAKLQQDFMEVQRAKELLQQAVIDRDKQIYSLRARIIELETQLIALKKRIDGDGSL